LAAACAGPASAEGGAAPSRPAFTLDNDTLKGYGINPDLIVSVHLSDGAKRIVIAEHRPGADSLLHVLGEDGRYLFGVPVPSPQLVDFALDGEGRKAFLVGSYGTRFYLADLVERKARLILSSQPDRPGFRALTPVSIVRGAEGPVVYGLFYSDEKTSRDLGFARVNEDGSATNVLSTLEWERKFPRMSNCFPSPDLKAALIVHQAAGSAEPAKAKVKRLVLAKPGAEEKELDSADDFVGASWAPNGLSIVYVRQLGSTRQLLMRLLSWDKPVVLAEGMYFSPKYLADRRLVVSSIEGKTDQALWTMEAPTGPLQRVEVAGKLALYAADPAGQALAAWGPWGLSVFRFRE